MMFTIENSVSYGIAIFLNHTFYIDYNIYMYQCINIFWAGGAYVLNFERDLTSIKEEKEIENYFNKLIIPVNFDKNKE